MAGLLKVKVVYIVIYALSKTSFKIFYFNESYE